MKTYSHNGKEGTAVEREDERGTAAEGGSKTTTSIPTSPLY
jgi:hypothetical protein